MKTKFNYVSNIVLLLKYFPFVGSVVQWNSKTSNSADRIFYHFYQDCITNKDIICNRKKNCFHINVGHLGW